MAGLGELANRLAHPLPDVRSRALRSLLSKLAGGLLVPADLAYERELQRNLLVSHAMGVGVPLATDVVRAMLLLLLVGANSPAR